MAGNLHNIMSKINSDTLLPNITDIGQSYCQNSRGHLYPDTVYSQMYLSLLPLMTVVMTTLNMPVEWLTATHVQ